MIEFHLRRNMQTGNFGDMDVFYSALFLLFFVWHCHDGPSSNYHSSGNPQWVILYFVCILFFREMKGFSVSCHSWVLLCVVVCYEIYVWPCVMDHCRLTYAFAYILCFICYKPSVFNLTMQSIVIFFMDYTKL